MAKSRVLAGKVRSKVWKVCDQRVRGGQFVDVLDAAGVDLREAEGLALHGCSDLEYWRAVARACAREGLEFHVHTLGPDGEPVYLV